MSNSLNGSKLHLARRDNSVYAVCRGKAIHGALNTDEFAFYYDNEKISRDAFCKVCLKRYEERAAA